MVRHGDFDEDGAARMEAAGGRTGSAGRDDALELRDIVNLAAHNEPKVVLAVVLGNLLRRDRLLHSPPPLKNVIMETKRTGKLFHTRPHGNRAGRSGVCMAADGVFLSRQ